MRGGCGNRTSKRREGQREREREMRHPHCPIPHYPTFSHSTTAHPPPYHRRPTVRYSQVDEDEETKRVDHLRQIAIAEKEAENMRVCGDGAVALPPLRPLEGRGSTSDDGENR